MDGVVFTRGAGVKKKSPGKLADAVEAQLVGAVRAVAVDAATAGLRPQFRCPVPGCRAWVACGWRQDGSKRTIKSHKFVEHLINIHGGYFDRVEREAAVQQRLAQ